MLLFFSFIVSFCVLSLFLVRLFFFFFFFLRSLLLFADQVNSIKNKRIQKCACAELKRIRNQLIVVLLNAKMFLSSAFFFFLFLFLSF